MKDFENNITDMDVAGLRSTAASITASIDAYEAADSQSDKNSALASIAHDAQQLKAASTAPSDAFDDFTFQPLANACVRIALSIGLFEHLPKPKQAGISIEQIASLTETEKALVVRVVRGLVAVNVVHQDDSSGLYSHTPMSVIYTDSMRRAWAIWLWDVMIQSAATGIGPYFDQQVKPIRNPTDPRNAPFSVAHDAQGSDVFEIVKSIGKLPLLNSAMSGSSVACAKEAVAAFDFAALEPGDDDIVLVDVGGAKGQTIQEIRKAYPAIKGRMVLQDLQAVLDDGALPDLEAETVAYDFFKETQPIKGAAAYLYQRIFHDWSDAECEKILESLKPAMTSHSKLLICDVVVQDQPPARKVMRDLNMLLVAGRERSQEQWQTLLEGSGFGIDAFHGLENSNNSIIEAHARVEGEGR